MKPRIPDPKGGKLIPASVGNWGVLKRGDSIMAQRANWAKRQGENDGYIDPLAVSRTSSPAAPKGFQRKPANLFQEGQRK